ncbi:MAG: glycosyltransferase family 2 protein [Gammaproteobacteria bacterium]|nr:glycosyltransferase family 2 protein [Gammaproteobacteria bacterium]
MGIVENPNPCPIAAIIPTYNRRTLVVSAIESVQKQTLPVAETIVIDDGSTDGTYEELTRRFPDITVLQQSNRGVSASRNLGIRHATAHWLAFLDSDDQWYPNKLERQMSAIQKEPARLCHCDEHWIRHGRRVNPMNKHRKRGGNIFEFCLPLCAISPSAVVIHRSFFDDVGLFDESLPACEDYDLWLRMTHREPVCFVDEPLLEKTGGHADQLSRRYAAMDQFRLTALAKLLRSNELDSTQSDQAQKMFEKKLMIFAKGAHKRGKQRKVIALLNEYEDLISAVLFEQLELLKV